MDNIQSILPLFKGISAYNYTVSREIAKNMVKSRQRSHLVMFEIRPQTLVAFEGPIYKVLKMVKFHAKG